MIKTHRIELECFDVNGAAIHASPTFMSSYIMKPMFLSLIIIILSWFSFPIAYNFFLKGMAMSDWSSFIFLWISFSFSFNFSYFSSTSVKVVVPTTATPTSADLNPPTSFDPSPAYKMAQFSIYLIFLMITSLSWGDVLAKILIIGKYSGGRILADDVDKSTLYLLSYKSFLRC